MTVSRWSRIVALLAFFGLASLASGQTPDSPDGLVKVTPRRMELAWLRPGADFRPYTKVIVDPTQVAFRPDWRKDYNLNASVGKLGDAGGRQQDHGCRADQFRRDLSRSVSQGRV